MKQNFLQLKLSVGESVFIDTPIERIKITKFKNGGIAINASPGLRIVREKIAKEFDCAGWIRFKKCEWCDQIHEKLPAQYLCKDEHDEAMMYSLCPETYKPIVFRAPSRLEENEVTNDESGDDK